MMDNENSPTRDDLQHKQAIEAHEVKEVLGFLQRYGKLIGISLVVAFLMIFGSSGIARYQASRWTKADRALMSAKTPQELEELVRRYGSTPSGPVALLDLAKTHFNRGETAQARAQYERFLGKYRKNDLRPVAELGLIYCTEAEGDFNAAAEQFAAFAKKYSTSYLYAPAILSIARCMQQAGRIDESRIVLEDFLAGNIGAEWAGAVEQELKQLAEAAQKNNPN